MTFLRELLEINFCLWRGFYVTITTIEIKRISKKSQKPSNQKPSNASESEDTSNDPKSITCESFFAAMEKEFIPWCHRHPDARLMIRASVYKVWSRLTDEEIRPFFLNMPHATHGGCHHQQWRAKEALHIEFFSFFS